MEEITHDEQNDMMKAMEITKSRFQVKEKKCFMYNINNQIDENNRFYSIRMMCEAVINVIKSWHGNRK